MKLLKKMYRRKGSEFGFGNFWRIKGNGFGIFWVTVYWFDEIEREIEKAKL